MKQEKRAPQNLKNIASTTPTLNSKESSKERDLWRYPAFDPNARWNSEKPRTENSLDEQDKKVRFGSWYNRKYDDYTCEEMYVPQGHKDRVRTADLPPEDAMDRKIRDDDSIAR